MVGMGHYEVVSAHQKALDGNTVIIITLSSCFSTERPDFTDAIILRKGASVEHVVISLHLLCFLLCRRPLPLGDSCGLCFLKLGMCQCLM